MGRPFLEFLDGTRRIYCCKLCHRTIADANAVLSKDFHSKHGRAYLLEKAINVSVGPAEDRMMTSGMHTVCDIHCTGCLYTLGWKYLVAYEPSQKYKEGKFILERVKILDTAEVEADRARQLAARDSSSLPCSESSGGSSGSEGGITAGMASIMPSETHLSFRMRSVLVGGTASAGLSGRTGAVGAGYGAGYYYGSDSGDDA